MKKCEYCDAKMDDNDYYCPSCGKTSSSEKQEIRRNTFFHRLFSFILPFLGLILYLLHRNSNTKLAKIAIRSAIVGVLFYILIFVLFIVYLILSIIVGIFS